MSLINGFNADTVAPSTGFDLLPNGTVAKAAIIEAEDKTTTAGTGQYLALTIEIIEGEFRGRKLWHNLNLQNPSEKAQQIAAAELSAICLAIATPRPTGNGDLMNKPFQITVGIEKRKDTGDDQNRIKKFAPVGGTNAAASSLQSGKAAAPAGKPAWAKS